MKFNDMPYTRVNYEEAEKKLTELTEAVKKAGSGEEQFEVHKKFYDVSGDIMTNLTLAHIRYSVDTTDEFYKAEKEYNDQIEPKLTGLLNNYQKALYESPYREYLVSKIGPVAFKNMEISFKAFDEKIIPLMQEENALTMEYNNLIAGAKIDWHGEILNISLLQPYLTSKDREIRKEAWGKLSEFFQGVTEQIDTIYDKLVANRTKQAQTMGYKDYVELGYYRMNRNSYGREEVEKFRSQIKSDFVPFAEKLHEERRKRLGLEKLSFIDELVYFKEGNPAPFGTPEEILAAGSKMYAQLSEETKEFFDFMQENELFDVLGRKTKKAGGYMTYIYNYKSPFVFANFNGTAGDVDVITHECGHAFQGYLSGKDPIVEHSDITMETAEIHSMSMEFFTSPYMEMFFGDRADAYRRMQVEDAAAFIPYGCMVDEFQHIVYSNPDLTPSQRKAEWKKLEETYKPHWDFGDDPFFGVGGFWQKQQHIFNSPFYYIDYVLAQTCAFQYKVWMDENYEEAWESYLKLCKLSASKFYADMLKEVGLKVPFEEGYFDEIVNKLSEKCAL